MAKRNKIRYQSKPKDFPTVTLSGKVFLQYADAEEEIDKGVKGDLLVYPSDETLHTLHMGAYDRTGFVGFFKAHIHDGWGWKPALINEFFPDRENYFGKTDRPEDVYVICKDMLEKRKGTLMKRAYREHFEPE